MPRRCLLFALALALGCKPSLQKLASGHHYDEAVAGANEGALPEHEVAAVVRGALDPALHVAVVPRAQLAALLGADSPDLDRHALLRVVYDSNTVPLASFSLDLRLRFGEVHVDPRPADLQQLAAAFQEPLPGPRTVEPGALERGLTSAGNAMRVVGALGAMVLHISTLGLSSAVIGRDAMNPKMATAQSRTEYPTGAELRRAAPRAASIVDAAAHLHGHCTRDPGVRCSALLLVSDLPQGTGDAALELTLRYGRFPQVFERLEVALPPGAILEDRLAARFGGAMRRLSELPLRPARG